MRFENDRSRPRATSRQDASLRARRSTSNLPRRRARGETVSKLSVLLPLPARNEWGEDRGEGNPEQKRASSPHEPLGTSNIQHPTSNIQHPTANQWPNWKPLVVRCWMLGVGCFPSVHGSTRDIFGEFSPRPSPPSDGGEGEESVTGGF